MSVYLNAFESRGKIYERYLDENMMERKRIVEDFKPSLFIENSNVVSDYKNIYDISCIKKTFDSISDASKSYRSSNVSYLGQEDFLLQYISDTYKDVIDLSTYLSHIRIANLDIEVPAPKFPSPNQAEYEIASIAHHDSVTKVYTVFVLVNKSQRWSKELSILPPELLEKVEVLTFSTEKELLVNYLRFWRENCPVAITGYNIDLFDIPYLYNRYLNVFGKSIADKLSPWGKIKRTLSVEWPLGIDKSKKTDALKETLIDKNKYHYEINIAGIESLDWLPLYKKFSFTPQPNYRLDSIGESEVGENKIHFRHNFMEMYGKSEIVQTKLYEDSHHYEYYAYMKHLLTEVGYTTLGTTPDVKNFMHEVQSQLLNVKDNLESFETLIQTPENRCAELYDFIYDITVQLAFQMITDYNIKDVELVNRLDIKRGFINLSLSIAYYAKINYESVMSPIKTWDAILFNSVKQQKVVLPCKNNKGKERYIGGHVKDPIKGLKKRVASFDLTSLYPSIIRQVNISPETFVTKQEPKHVNEMPPELLEEEHGAVMHSIEELLSGNMIYDNSQYSLSANGASYTKEKLGVIPIEINKIFQERRVWKGQMFKHDHNIKAIEKELKKRGVL